ncbi:MAG: hypothetical protein QME14_02115 [Methanobacteriaceae archaeon]|nr:hypothetical protein [Methanobacteriaceae archaeon]
MKEAEEIYHEARYKRPDAFQLSSEDKERFIKLFGADKLKSLFSESSISIQ